METEKKTTTDVVAERLNSASVRYSNSGDPDRLFDISADVTIDRGQVTGFSSGTVADLSGGPDLASFNDYGDRMLHLDIDLSESAPGGHAATTVLEAVMLFMKNVGASVRISPSAFMDV